jgi:hypothetical protein
MAELLVSQRDVVQLPGEGVDVGREPVAFDADCGELVAEQPVFLYYGRSPATPPHNATNPGNTMAYKTEIQPRRSDCAHHSR